MLDRSQVVEIGVSVAAVGLMIAALYVIGLEFTASDGTLPTAGANVAIGTIVGFIVLLIVIGVAMALHGKDSNST